jgi:hypothetical protein
MRTLIKLTFFVWLAITAMLAWSMDWQLPSGQIALVMLCLLSFVGGLCGILFAIHDTLYKE